MAKEIKITKKQNRKGDDGYKIVSVRMKDEMIEQLDMLSAQRTQAKKRGGRVISASPQKRLVLGRFPQIPARNRKGSNLAATPKG